MALTCGRALLALLAVYVAILSHTLLELFYPSPCRGAACLQPLLRSGAAVDLQAHIDGRLVWSAAGVSSGAGLEDVAFAVPVPAEVRLGSREELHLDFSIALAGQQQPIAHARALLCARRQPRRRSTARMLLAEPAVSSSTPGSATSDSAAAAVPAAFASSEQSGVAPPNERGEVPHYLYAAASLELRLVADETPHAGPVLPSDGAVVANGVDWSRRVYAPRLYVDELGLLGKHALPLSSDVGKEPPRLRLRLLPISLGRYRATRQLHTALGALQAASGMEAEFDELRELLSEKRLYRFALMQLIGLLHVVFDALAFRNDVGFWKGREDLRGLSSRGVIFNAGSTLVIFLYLLDGDGVNSIVLATYAFSTALELWKLTKVVAMRRRARGAAGGAGGEGARAEAATERFDEVATRHLTWGLAPLVVGWALYALLHYPHASWYSWLLGSLADAIYLFGFIAMTPQLFINYKAPRGAEMARDGPSSPKIPRSSSATRRFAAQPPRTLQASVPPRAPPFPVPLPAPDQPPRFCRRHGAPRKYTRRFEAELPRPPSRQMKSVAHLPWRVLAYKAFNTFIDDAFALMVAMPTAHRVACLRDDLVFLVLLYQRRLYPVDRKRANEFGIAYERDEADVAPARGEGSAGDGAEEGPARGVEAEGEVPTRLLDLPTELLVRVVSRCDPADIARVAAVSHIFHASLAKEGIRLWAQERGFELAAQPEGEGCAVRWLCLAALLRESNPPVRASTGRSHSVFIDGEGRLSSCGSEWSYTGLPRRPGLLGHGEGVTRLDTPTRLSSTLGGERAVSVSAGVGHTLALTADGAVWSWGDGNYGQLGHGDRQYQLLPKKVEAFAGQHVVAVSAGDSHSLAITADGAVWSWCQGAWGQLGHGDKQPQWLPKKIEAFAGQRVVAASAGAQHSLALTADGAVWSWGWGGDGVLGHGDREDQLLPKRVEAFAGRRVVAVSAADRHSLALAADGAVWSWGEGGSKGGEGWLGHGGGQRQLLPKKVEALAEQRVLAVSAGAAHSLALTADSAVWSWGWGACGQLGHGDQQSRLLPKKVEAFADQNVIAVSAGVRHSLALTGDGAVFTWGKGDTGCLGHGADLSKQLLPKKVER